MPRFASPPPASPRRRRRAAFAGCLLLGACGSDAPAGAGWTATVDTLASGVVRVHNPERGAWAAAPRSAWRPVERTRIGIAEGDGPELFGRIAGVTGDALGRIYVLDALAKEVRVFAASGAHVRRFGREGEGPGEFGRPIALTWDPDGRLWVVDPGNARFSVFDTAGTYLATYRREHPGSSPGWGGRFDLAGRILDPGCVLMGGRICEPAVVRFDPDDGWDAEGRPMARDTFYEPRYAREAFRTRVGGRTLVFGAVPFAPRSHWTLAANGDFWFGTSDTYTIYRRAPEGDTLRIVEREAVPVPVSAAEREAAIAELQPAVEAARRLGVTLDLSRIPDAKPAFSGLIVDEEGYLWVARPPAAQTDGESGVEPADPDATAFDVFDPEGRFLGSLTAPIGLAPRPWIAGKRIVGVYRDALDVQYVISVEIVGRPASRAATR